MYEVELFFERRPISDSSYERQTSKMNLGINKCSFDIKMKVNRKKLRVKVQYKFLFILGEMGMCTQNVNREL